jgi:hypothetical protein
MRVVLAVMVFIVLSGEALAGATGCHKRGVALEGVELLFDPDTLGASSFRGIGLASKPDHIMAVGLGLGFEVCALTFVGEADTVSAIEFWDGSKMVAQAHFDRQGNMQRLSLKDRYFHEKPIFVRDFADEIFERYAVRPAKVDDDVCFQDVTCFKGVSKYGEQFLIMRFGTEAELFVRPVSKEED